MILILMKKKCLKTLKMNLNIIFLICIFFWILFFHTWNKLRDIFLESNLNINNTFPNIIIKIIETPIFLKIIFFSIIIFFHSLILKNKKLKNSEKILFFILSIFFGIIIYIFLYKEIYNIISQYKISLYQSLK